MQNYMKKLYNKVKRDGLKGFVLRICSVFERKEITYDEWYKKKLLSLEKQNRRVKRYKYRPLISIVVPVYNTPITFLREMVDSLKKQTYDNWELCIADGSGENIPLKKELEILSQNDKRIKFVVLSENKGIAANTNEALVLATGEYVGLLDHDDFLAPQALSSIIDVLQEEEIDVFYSDEDFVSGDGQTFILPILKPDYSIDLLCSHNYITHFFVVKREIIKKVGGFRSEYDGSQDYDIIFRCLEHAKGVKHIPEILYHWRMHSGSVAGDPESKTYAYDAGLKAIESHFKRTDVKASVECIQGLHGMYHTSYEILDNPKVSIIIANIRNDSLVENNIVNLLKNSSYKNIEIILIDGEEVKHLFQKHTFYLEKYPNVKVCLCKNGNNYAQINNYGAKHATGNYLLFLNSELEITTSTGIEELLGVCIQERVGAVGGKVLFKDNTVRHAGIVIGRKRKIEYPFVGIDNMDDGYLQRPRINCDYSAVSWLCMIVRKELFQQMHGFNTHIDNGISDVEFCYRLREQGKRIVYVANSQWKTKTTGKKIYGLNRHISRQSRQFLKKITKKRDPYYNKNFSANMDLFSVKFK